jgi:RHS repeat-associated protein
MRYTYNAENRLIAAGPETPTDGATRVEFVYDYMGRRVQKIVYVYGSATWQVQKEILFVYDGWNVAQEITREGGSDASRYYVWGLDLSQSVQGAGGVGGLLAAVDSSLTYHYLYDSNGNVGQVINAGDGSVAAHYEYDPFSNLVNQAGDYADENPYRFSTKYYDSEVNLYYYGFRYYSPELGRWIRRDPHQEKGGINLYVFVENKAANKFDPFGLFAGERSQWEQEYDAWEDAWSGQGGPFSGPIDWDTLVYEFYEIFDIGVEWQGPFTLPSLDLGISGLKGSFAWYIPVGSGVGGIFVKGEAKKSEGCCTQSGASKRFERLTAEVTIGAYV